LCISPSREKDPCEVKRGIERQKRRGGPSDKRRKKGASSFRKKLGGLCCFVAGKTETTLPMKNLLAVKKRGLVKERGEKLQSEGKKTQKRGSTDY